MKSEMPEHFQNRGPTRSAAKRQALDQALAQIEDAREIVGQHVPLWAQEWAEKNGLEVRETSFAPPGKLFLVGAFPVDGANVEVGRV